MAMERSLQEILESLLAGQEKMKADINADAEARQQRAEARQEKMITEMKAAYAEMEAE
jgi:hypothetical protein